MLALPSVEVECSSVFAALSGAVHMEGNLVERQQRLQAATRSLVMKIVSWLVGVHGPSAPKLVTVARPSRFEESAKLRLARGNALANLAGSDSA